MKVYEVATYEYGQYFGLMIWIKAETGQDADDQLRLLNSNDGQLLFQFTGLVVDSPE